MTETIKEKLDNAMTEKEKADVKKKKKKRIESVANGTLPS